MTTIRLTRSQKDKLERASRIMRSVTGRKVSQGQTVEMLAEFALRQRALLAASVNESSIDFEKDPFFDLSIAWDLGRTDARTVDRVLYGRK